MPPLTIGERLETWTFSSGSKGGLQEVFKPPSDLLCYQWHMLNKMTRWGWQMVQEELLLV